MDISTQAEIVLRAAGYDTWTWSGTAGPVTCFESTTVVGFLHVFDSAPRLVETWGKVQELTLLRHAAALRAAGTKAWNVYSVFLTSDHVKVKRVMEQIEEDFTLTRKIARASVATQADVEHAFLPLTPIRSQPQIGATDFQDRLKSRLTSIQPETVKSFLEGASVDEIARRLGAVP